MQLVIEGVRILPLLLIHRKPVLPKDDVIPHPYSKQRSSTRCFFPPSHPASFVETHNNTRLLCFRGRIIRTSHLNLSTNSTSLTVKWKTPFARKSVPSSYCIAAANHRLRNNPAKSTRSLE